MISFNQSSKQLQLLQTELEAHIQEFIANGGQIQHVPDGVGKDWAQGRGHKTLSQESWQEHSRNLKRPTTGASQ